MKSTFLISFFALLMATGCTKTNETGDVLIPDTPRSDVPAALIGKWLNGTFAMANWWSNNGTTYEGNPYSRSTAFTFSRNGDAEFFQVISTYNGSCSQDGFTYMKGSVQFNNSNHSFTFYPQQGNFRGNYSCNSGSNFDRSATVSELKAATYYWSTETLSNQQYMVIRFDSNPNSAGTYFKPSNW